MDQEILYIKWRDACYRGDYTDIGDIGGTLELEEVGFLVTENEEAITLSVENQHEDPHIRFSLTIPRCNIVELKRTTLEAAFQAKPNEIVAPKSKKRKKKIAALVEAANPHAMPVDTLLPNVDNTIPSGNKLEKPPEIF